MRAIELNGAAVEMNKQGLRLGPPGRARPGRGAARRGHRRRAGRADFIGTALTLGHLGRLRRRGQALADRSTRRIALRAQVPHRIPGRRATRSATPSSSAKVRAVEAERTPGLDRPDRSRGALRLQADGLQGRVRSRAPVHHRRFRKARARDLRRRLQAATSTSRRRCSASATPTATCVKREYGPWVFTAFKLLKRLKFLRGSAVRSVRQDRRAAHGAPADRRLPRHHRGAARRPEPGQPRAGGRDRARARSTSAATATSRKRTWPRPRPGGRAAGAVAQPAAAWVARRLSWRDDSNRLAVR